MTKGKRLRISRALRRAKEEGEKQRLASVAEKIEDKIPNRANTIFKTEEIQEICSLLKLEEVGDQHCFLGAVVIGRYDVVKKILKEGQNIDALDENRETALMHAVKQLRMDMVSFLLNRGADISLMDAEGNTAVMMAAQSSLWDQDAFFGLWTSVKDNSKFKIDQTNKAGYSLLHYIIKRQWQSVLDQLLNFPIVVDIATKKGVTALMMAASRGDHAMVKVLLDAGADFSIEDQQKCTALCYAIAFSLQKNVTESNRALEILLATVNDENSKLTLEQYLQRRLQLICCPPRGQTKFIKTMNGVIVYVLTFFARFIYSGFELLLELNIFLKLKEALEKNCDDTVYIQAVLNIVSELVKFCSCCCQGLSQVELADAFFAAGLGKTCLDILDRYGSTKTAITKSVFIPLTYICSSESYSARTWLESHHKSLQMYYNKYMRSFPSVLMDTNNDVHLEIEKKCSLSFQNIMKTLKTKGQIVSKEEHLKAATKLKEQKTLSSVYKILNQNAQNSIRVTSDKRLNPFTPVKRKKSKPSTIYNSIIQYNFGKLDIIQSNPTPTERDRTPTVSSQNEDSLTEKFTNDDVQTERVKRRERKSRIAIKEVQLHSSESKANNNGTVLHNIDQNSKSQEEKNKLTTPKLEAPVKRFSDGYQLFKMEDEVMISDDDSSVVKHVCDWLDSSSSKDESKTVSDQEVSETLKRLEEIFIRIVNCYSKKWEMQSEEGYLGAKGSREDLLKLISVLPALENYHMEKLINKWEEFCKQIKECASKNHIVYGAMVSEIQLFLLEFEADLEKRNAKTDNTEDEESSIDSYLDTQEVLKNPGYSNVDVLSDGKPVEYLINKNGLLKIKNIEKDYCDQLGIEDGVITPRKIVDYLIENDSVEDHLKDSVWNRELFKSPFDKILSEKSNSLDEMANSLSKARSEVVNQTDNTESKNADEKKKETSESIQHPNANVLVQKILDELKEIETNISFNDNTSSPSTEPSFVDCLELKQEINISNTSKEKYSILQKDKEETSKNKTHSEKQESSNCKNTEEPKILFKTTPSELEYCGLKYAALCIDLEFLPSCKTELLDNGNIRIASTEFQLDFKLFNGFNFGDVCLGVSSKGMPLAVRKFDKLDSACNRMIRKSLLEAVTTMLPLRHSHVLSYLAACDTPLSVVVVQPLCYQDMGQYIWKVGRDTTCNQNSLPKVFKHLTSLVQQMIFGLHYLHTRETPIVHGNLKPSNVLIDSKGSVRLAEFGLHKSLFQQRAPTVSSSIWWSRDTIIPYYRNWKYFCSLQSDMQSAGMLAHFILSIGKHPFGQELADILLNIQNGTIYNLLSGAVESDLIYWMLSHDGSKRPTTHDVLRHVLFWSKEKRWDFLNTCCGKGLHSLSLHRMYQDLDMMSNLKNINSKWISVMKQNFKNEIGNDFLDTPSGLLQFMRENLKNWSEIKSEFLEVFAVLPLNLFRMIEQTVWIEHPQFKPFTKIETSL